MLLARALAVATTRFPYLSAVRVGADGSLAGLRVAAGAHSQAASEGAVAIMANLLGLLITFIGEDLTLRLLSTAWPGLDSDGGFDSDGGTDRENEKP